MKMQRPSYNERYIHIGTDGYNYITHRASGQNLKIYGNHPCKCCIGFRDNIACQYGPGCYSRFRHMIPKPDMEYRE